MKGINLAAGLVRSVSVAALAAGLAMPALAQTATPADPQQGTPSADTAASTPLGADAGASATDPQPGTAADDTSGDIVVTGIRASLERSIAIKRDSNGVVDAISAEDIGKFPNTNLAESLQRIPGVSIDRRGGEGATVTVRGFGPQYNLVTLNGRQLATSDIVAVGGDQGGDGAAGNGRSFNFSNLVAEGVKTLEVYKTGRAAIPSGGIGATVNVVTQRPLDRRQSGLTGSIGGKAVYDTSSDDCVDCGSQVTPEFSGVVSWSNPNDTFGVSLFGAYQKRNFSFPSQANDAWNIRTLADFLDPSQGFVTATTKINNAPADGSTLVAVPNDSRWHYSEASRERINGQAIMQFKPTETLTLTVDGLYAQLRESERRSSQSNWFGRPFDEVTFDDASDGIATTKYLHETNGGGKDEAFEQAYRAQKNRLWDIGGNLEWRATDRLTIALDGHYGRADSFGDNPNGQTSTTVAFNAPVVQSHSLLWDDEGFPQMNVVVNDGATGQSPASTANPNGLTFTKGNNNGVIDLGDLSGAVQRQFDSAQSQRIKEIRLDAGYELDGGSRFDGGASFRETNTRQTQYNTSQVLGDWNNALPPDIDRLAPGQVFQFCTACQFHHNDPNADPVTAIGFRTQDATKLYNTLFNYYSGLPLDPNQTLYPGASVDGINHANRLDANNDNRVNEKIWAVYGQFTWKGEVGGMNATVNAGVRFENTDVYSVSLQPVPTAIVWTADNDFRIENTTDRQPVTGKGSYNNILPAVDVALDFTRTLKGRVSYSKTIARPPYGNLFASTGVGAPPRPTVIGGVASGFSNDTDLDPLTSDNFDVTLEWYPRRDVYLAVGFFDKRVQNFIGNTLVNRNLFGLRDPTSGAPGSRSGIARDQLTAGGAGLTDRNLFTYTALLTQNGGNVAQTNTQFFNAFNAGGTVFDQLVDSTLAAVDLIGDANDPLFNFSVNTPINNKDAEIYGVELSGQYFLGNTGFGIAASYTLVRGDVGIDNAAPTDVDQFALVGLSDTANVTAIYDKNGISARLAWNWRDKFLSQLNRDSYHNPVYTAPYSQVDFSVSYDVTPQIAVSLEGINIFEEGIRTYTRDYINTFYEAEGSARYLAGVRFRF